jgi:hypothetical protein
MAPCVDQAVVGDREDPGPKCLLLAIKGGDVARHLQEDLAEDVLRVRRVVSAQVAEDAGRKPAIEFLPGGLAPLPGRLQERGEALREHSRRR